MKMITQSIVVKENRNWGAKPPADAVGELLRLITPAVRYSIRMRFEGRSTFRGIRPAWLDAASDVRFVAKGGKKDETTLFFDIPQLGEAAPKLYEQHEFWSARPAPTDTGFDLLGDVIKDVAQQDADSERYDNPLLRRIGRFDHALNGTFQGLDIVAQRYSVDAPAEINHNVVEIAKKWTNNTPQPQAVRVFGKLDMIRASTQSFALQLLTGEEVRGVVDGFEVGTLTQYFQKSVLVLGRAVYRPSGRLLRIDASEVKPAGDDQRFFSKMPAPREGRIDRKTLLRPTSVKNGIAAIFGKWPGDETDEQVEAALREIS